MLAGMVAFWGVIYGAYVFLALKLAGTPGDGNRVVFLVSQMAGNLISLFGTVLAVSILYDSYRRVVPAQTSAPEASTA
jgi:hypothetical protein